MSGIFAVFTPDCVSFCEVSSHAANSKGRRLRFLGSHRRIVMLFYLILFAPDSFRNLFNQLELVPLLQPGQLVADLAGDKTTLRAQAEAVHFSASWMRAITVSLCRKRLNFEQRGCFHQRAGPWSLVGFLVQHQVNVVLCGGIGAGAQAALVQAGIQLFGGISGSVDAAAADYLAGRLVFDPNAHCNHHAHEAEHACGSHSCHEDKGGCAGSCH